MQRECTWPGSVRGNTSSKTNNKSGTLSSPVVFGYSCFVLMTLSIHFLSVAPYHCFLSLLIGSFLFKTCQSLPPFHLLLQGNKADAFSGEPQTRWFLLVCLSPCLHVSPVQVSENLTFIAGRKEISGQETDIRNKRCAL